MSERAQSLSSRTPPRYVPGAVVFRVHPDAIPWEWETTSPRPAFDRLPADLQGLLAYLRREKGLRYMEPYFREFPPGTRRHRGTRLDDDALAIFHSVEGEEYVERLAGTVFAKFRADSVDGWLLRRLRSNRAVEYAARVPTRRLFAPSADPALNLQWGLRAIRWFDARIPPGRTRDIGMMDTGIDRSHPDLARAIRSYTHEYRRTLGAQIDRHIRFMATDRDGHGTHVAGILAARSNDARGVSGTTESKLHVWKIFPDRQDFDLAARIYVLALRKALDADICALNLSIGAPDEDPGERSAIEDLINSGVTVVAAMGNDGRRAKEYPAAFDIPGLVAVGAVSERLDLCAFSNTGDHLDIVAPGINILSTVPHRRSRYGPKDLETGYRVLPGTSMATPYVTAAAALVSSAYPGLTAAQVEAHLCRTSTRVPGMGRRKRTDEYGHGLLNVKEALARPPSL